MCIIDAEDFSECPISQFEEIWILRELNKALVGFDSPEDCVRLSPLGESRSGSPDALPPPAAPLLSKERQLSAEGKCNGVGPRTSDAQETDHVACVNQKSSLSTLACRKAVPCLQDLAPGLTVSLDADTAVRLSSLEAKTRDDDNSQNNSTDDGGEKDDGDEEKEVEAHHLGLGRKPRMSVDEYITCYEDSDEFQSASSSMDLHCEQHLY
jgi:hypothetical protein